jgi:hypothetical protein
MSGGEMSGRETFGGDVQDVHLPVHIICTGFKIFTLNFQC